MNKKTALHNHIREEDGIALMLALLFIVLLTAIVVNFSYEMQVEATLMSSVSNDREAYLAARSGIATAMSVLHADLMGTDETAPTTYDGPDEPWALPGEPIVIEDALVNMTIKDEYGKLNLNALLYQLDPGGDDVEHPYLVTALEIVFQNARQLDVLPIDVILDWIDADDYPRPNGAESDYYMDLDLPYLCKNGPMDSIEELLLLPGITPEIYFGSPQLEETPLFELFTVHGHPEGKLNVNTAPLEVLDAVIQAQELAADAQTIYDQIKNGSPVTTEEELTQLGLIPEPPAADPNAIPQQGTAPVPTPEPIKMFDVKSEVFRIWSDAQLDDTDLRIEAYVWRDTNQTGEPQMYRVIDWKTIR